MARNEPREQQGRIPIRFEGLDGTPDDDDEDAAVETDAQDTEQDDDRDPRADDPFREQGEGDEGREELERQRAEAADEGEGEDESGQDGKDEGDDKQASQPDSAVHDADLRAVIARQQQEIERLQQNERLTREQVQKSNKELYETRAKHIDEDLSRARGDLEKAIEDGETKRQVELQDRLAELHATKRELASMQQAADRQAEEQPRRDEEKKDEGAPNIQAQTEAARRWMRGRAWINDPSYGDANRDLVRIAGALAEIDGYDPNSEDYYAELERRMKRRHPGLFSNGSATPKRRPAQQSVGRVSRDDPPRARDSRKTGKLTAEDRQTMELFSLDWRDPAVVKEFLRNKTP